MSVHVGKNISTKYYKYVYAAWTQPELTSNTSDSSFKFIDPKLSGGTINDSTKVMTWGTSSVTRFNDLYRPFNSSTSDNFTLNNGSRTFTVFDILFSTKMSISACTIVGNVVSSQASSLTGSQLYSVDSSGKATLLSTSTSSNTNTHTINNVVTNRLRICMRPNSDGNTYPSRITKITITARKITGTVAGTSSDYDYKVYNDGNSSVHLGYLIRYVDYVELYGDWTQPVLSDNGTVGGDQYACRVNNSYNSNAYNAFDNNTATAWEAANRTENDWIEFYSPEIIKVSKITFTNRNSYTTVWTKFNVFGSLDGKSYFSLGSYTNNNSATSGVWSINLSILKNTKYLKIQGNGPLIPDGTARVSIAELDLTAKVYLGESLASNIPATAPYPPYINQYTKVGSPQVSGDGIASNFSSSNYLTFPSAGSNDIKECVIKFTTGSDVTTRQALFFGTRADNSASIYIQNSQVMLCNKSYGSAMSAKNPNLPALTANTTYYLKVVTSGNNVTMSLKKGTGSWTQGDVVTKSHNFGNYIGYGINNDDGSVAKCTYDLKECYINLTNSVLLKSYYIKVTSTEPFKRLHEGKANFIYKGSQLVYGVFTSLTFYPSTELKEWIVPNGVSKIHVDCVASKGRDGSAAGGNGGRVQCDLKVTPGQKLYFMVGNIPQQNTWTAEYNASDVRLGGKELNNRIIVAGGGGSASHNGQTNAGGAGGGLTGANGGKGSNISQSTGGTQTSGGAGGYWTASGSVWRSDGGAGEFGLGGFGGNARDYVMGGAGGSGWYGGGGGGAMHWSNGNGCGGGSGGSSYTNSAYCSNVVHTQGYRNGAGYIKITMI